MGFDCCDGHKHKEMNNMGHDKCKCQTGEGFCEEMKDCECPLRLLSRCVFYSGCFFFDTGVKTGDDFDEVVSKINHAISRWMKAVKVYRDENEELRDRIKKLENTIHDMVKKDF